MHPVLFQGLDGLWHACLHMKAPRIARLQIHSCRAINVLLNLSDGKYLEKLPGPHGLLMRSLQVPGTRCCLPDCNCRAIMHGPQQTKALFYAFHSQVSSKYICCNEGRTWTPGAARHRWGSGARPGALRRLSLSGRLRPMQDTEKSRWSAPAHARANYCDATQQKGCP